MGEYAIYLRKSRADIEAEAHGEGETLLRHQQILTETAERMNLRIGRIYREIVSGETISARPVVRQLLSDVEAGLWSGVLVVEVERLARGDTIDQGIVARTFKYSRTSIVTPLKVYRPWEEFDEEYFEFGLFMSRREYKTILRRMQNGRSVSAGEGKYCGSVAPYGYSRKKLENEKGFTLEIVPKQAEAVRMIFELAGSYRLGASKIADRLNLMQLPTPSHGSVWSCSTVSDILHNPVYCGMIRWGARRQVKSIQDGRIVQHRPRDNSDSVLLVKGRHPAIVEKAVWESVQKNICGTHYPVRKDKALQNPFAGLIFCGGCSRPLTRRSGKIPMLICTTDGCAAVGSKLEFVEQALLYALSQYLSGHSFKIEPSNNSHLQNELSLLRQNLDSLQKRSELLFSLLEEGVYSADTFLMRKQKNDQQIAAATKAIEDMSREIFCHENISEEITSCGNIAGEMPCSENISEEITSCGNIAREMPSHKNISEEISIAQLLELYRTSDPKGKNTILKHLINKIIYTKEKGGRNHSTAFRLYIYMNKDLGQPISLP